MYYIERSDGRTDPQPYATLPRALAALEAETGEELEFSRDTTGTRVSRQGQPFATIAWRREKRFWE